MKLLACQRIFHGDLQSVDHQRMGGFTLKRGDFGNGGLQSIWQFQ